MFFCFTGKFRDLLPVFFHDIHFSILLFILRKKRGQLDLREKKKITVLCQITKFQAFLQVFLYISGHTHLRKCDFHAFPPHVSFFSFYHLEYAVARTRQRQSWQSYDFLPEYFLGTNVRFLLDNRTDVCYTRFTKSNKCFY